MDTKGFEAHDHRACIASAVSAAEAFCDQNGLQFTDQRRRVLEILLAQHRAMGAYEILDLLRDDGMAAQPPVAYRALDFLVGHGFAHKVERLNAFIACVHPGEHHKPAFLICQVCKSVAEAPCATAREMLSTSAKAAGFHIDTAVIEAVGTCPNCEIHA